MAKRIQRQRTKGWRKPEGAVIVDRTSCWGNPFKVGNVGVPNAKVAADLFRSAILLSKYGADHFIAEPDCLHMCIMDCMPGPIPKLEAIKRELRGKDLACGCPLDKPCHADVLLEIANAK